MVWGKAFRESTYFREQVFVFSKADDCTEFTTESIVSAGEKAVVYLYKGKLTDNLDSLRYTCSARQLHPANCA